MTATPPNAARREALSGRLAAGAERLRERLARTPADSASEPDSALAPWARAFAAGDLAALERRLSWDGWTPVQAATALTDRQGPLDLPAWLADAESFAVVGRDLRQVGRLDGRLQRPTMLPFGALWEAWVASAVGRLAAETSLWSELPVAERERLAQALGEEIARVSVAAAREWLTELAASEPGVADEAAIDRALASGLSGLYEVYPVLLRQTVRLVVTWVETLSELSNRLAADREGLARGFGVPGELGRVDRLERLASDRHAGGRGVFALRFESGFEVVYKPRSLQIEAAFARFVDALRSRGAGDLPPVARVLTRAGYGWMERVLHSGPQDDAAVSLWFRRAGGLVALAELLGGQDLHAENLVATAFGPVVVDAEMLLQPDRAGADLARTRSFAAGLLPRPGARDREASWAGLVPVEWTAGGGPALRNACVSSGRAIAPSERASDLLAGYEATWRFLLAERPWLTGPGGPFELFGGSRVRLLFRASQDYAAVLALLAEPRHQRAGLASGLLLEGLLRPFAEHAAPPLLWPLVAAECQALEDLDLPRFEVAADERSVPAERGSITGLLVRSGLEAARARLEELDAAGIAGRVAEIADALAPGSSTQIAPPDRGAGVEPARDFGPLAVRLADALAAATAAELPVDRALSAGDRLAALALYDGAIGVAVALAETDRRLGGDRLATRMPPLLDDLETLAGDLETAPETAASLPIGGLTGLGSVVWGLVALAEGTGSALAGRCLEVAGRFATLTARGVAGDRRLDLEGGAAGALLGLLALAERSGEPVHRQAAIEAGERLLAAQRPDGGWAGERGLALAGFAHGAAGIARALDALARATGQGRYAAAARVGLRFERSFYDVGRANWPVLQSDPRLGEARRSWMTAWCHGAPGVALGRALAPGLEDAELAGEVAVAIGTTLASGLGTQDHLCCGAAGRIAVLAAVGELRGEREWRAAARTLAAGLVERGRTAGGWRLPAGGRAARRGLFRGEAGLVWLLARLAREPGTNSETVSGVPDPIRLELPSEAATRRSKGENG